MNKGIFCISIDTELLWGRSKNNWKSFIPRAKKTRFVISSILNLFDKYNIPATWAIVGKLYEKGNPLWHARDVIANIKERGLHEIACHSYTHLEFDTISSKKARDEIKKCIELSKKEGVKLSSFIFPKNKIAHLDVLKKYGFKSFRGKDAREWELLFPSAPPVYHPTKTSGLTDIRGSMYFVSSRGIRKYIPGWIREVKCRIGIQRAIRTKKIFHLWFHPIDLTDQHEMLLGVVDNVLKYANKQRASGKLEIKTMEGIEEKLDLSV